MRPIVCLVILALFSATASAQSVELTKSPEEILAIRQRVTLWLRTCINDWDPATHMNRTEWRTTCERVASERGLFILDNQGAHAMLSLILDSHRRCACPRPETR
jgi:hypothetical protein